LNEMGGFDVLIVGRGGGSLEDLWPFNEESVARAIAASHIPVVSAVGHEIDFTIADFVADVRAPTPSAAAELVVRDRQDILKRVERGLTLLPHLRTRLQQRMRVTLELWRRVLEESIGTLHALSPLAILGRGYSITRRWPELTVLRAASAVSPGEVVQVRLAAG